MEYTYLKHLMQAGYPAINVVTCDEDIIMHVLWKLCIDKDLERRLVSWSVTEGFIDITEKRKRGSKEDDYILKDKDGNLITDPASALNMASLQKLGAQGNTVWVFKDLHLFMQSNNEANALITRSIKDLLGPYETSHQTLIVLSARVAIPPELEKDIVIYDAPLPTKEILSHTLTEIIEKNPHDGGEKKPNQNGNADKSNKCKDIIARTVNAASGLGYREAKNAFSLALIKTDGNINEDCIRVVQEEKESVLKKSGLLEVVKVDTGLSSVGGLAAFKGYLQETYAIFNNPEKAAKKLLMPKGALIAGVPGSGKSLIAKCVAHSWAWPLLRLDMSRIFGPLLGTTENSFRKVMAICEQMSPVVLLIDELEKAFAGGRSSGMTDGGVTSRVIGQFLTFLQERKGNVFIVATANGIDSLPPEMLRPGRFDALFFVDVPNLDERMEIIRIHASKRQIVLSDTDVKLLAEKTDRYTGAEIESGIAKAIRKTFIEDKMPSAEHIAEALRGITPVYRKDEWDSKRSALKNRGFIDANERTSTADPETGTRLLSQSTGENTKTREAVA